MIRIVDHIMHVMVDALDLGCFVVLQMRERRKIR
jgi:hypothetical protein